jgi:hypothetical protein
LSTSNAIADAVGAPVRCRPAFAKHHCSTASSLFKIVIETAVALAPGNRRRRRDVVILLLLRAIGSLGLPLYVEFLAEKVNVADLAGAGSPRGRPGGPELLPVSR